MTTTPSISGTELTDTQTRALLLKLTVLADDEIILAHRDGEWTGHAPILEEDIALANIAMSSSRMGACPDRKSTRLNSSHRT